MEQDIYFDELERDYDELYEPEHDMDYDPEYDDWDDTDDAYALASAGFGVDEDYITDNDYFDNF